MVVLGFSSMVTGGVGSIRRLDQLICKLHRDGQYEEYNNILQEQLHKEIIEPLPDDFHGKEFYIPHKGVNRVNAEST